MRISAIPSVTPMRSIYPARGIIQLVKQKKAVYYKPKSNTPIPILNNIFTTKEIPLDCFEEGNELKVIGDFPGIAEEDLVIQISKDELCVVTKPLIDRKYQAVITLPKGFTTIIGEKIRNGVLTITIGRG